MEGTGRMDDARLRVVTREIEEVARAIYGATAAGKSELSRDWGDLPEAIRDELRRMAAVAIDARDTQNRGLGMTRPLRILIAEGTHEAELNTGAVQGSLSLLADADEAYVFHGDTAVCLKHRDHDVSNDPFSVAVAIQRRQPS